MSADVIYFDDELVFWADLLHDNEGDEQVEEAVRALRAGEVTEVLLGGGASPECRLATTPPDRTLPIGATVAFPDGKYGQGTVLYEYIMPPHARGDSWGFYSHPGSRVYVCRFPETEHPKEISCGVGQVEVVTR